jgi:hypothetical protein
MKLAIRSNCGHKKRRPIRAMGVATLSLRNALRGSTDSTRHNTLGGCLINKPSAHNWIHWPITNGPGFKAFLGCSGRVSIWADREQSVLELGLLCRGQVKPNADGGQAARIDSQPRFHGLFIRWSA